MSSVLTVAFELGWRVRSHRGLAGASSLVALSLGFRRGIFQCCYIFTAVQCAQRTGKGGRELREGNCISSLLSQFKLGDRLPVELARATTTGIDREELARVVVEAGDLLSEGILDATFFGTMSLFVMLLLVVLCSWRGVQGGPAHHLLFISPPSLKLISTPPQGRPGTS